MAGLSVAYYLSRFQKFDIELFESSSVLGGHAHTVDYQGVPLDTSVVTYHKDAYSRFSSLIAELGLESETRVFRQDLCFHSNTGTDYLVSLNPKAWLGSPLLLGRTLSAFRKLSSVIAQNRGLDPSLSIREFLQKNTFSTMEIDHLILPMMHMFLVVDLEVIARLPASYMIGLLYDHKVLHHSAHNSFLAWKNGTRTYVDALAKAIRGRAHVNAPVQSVSRSKKKVILSVNGEDKIYDRLILASPPRRSLVLLADPSPIENHLLSLWQEKSLTMKLHTDASVLPKSKSQRGFWNSYLDKASGRCSASYVMQKLQPRTAADVVVSWDPIQPIAEQKIHYQKQFVISELTKEALLRQPDLKLLNRQGNNTYFCGSYFSFGWHESAVESAHEVCGLLRNET